MKLTESVWRGKESWDTSWEGSRGGCPTGGLGGNLTFRTDREGWPRGFVDHKA